MVLWGRELPVNGKRPSWLGDKIDSPVDLKTSTGWWYSDGSAHSRTAEHWAWGVIEAIRLPTDHIVYRALDAGFEPWLGGKAAPDDWDGGLVLLRTTYRRPLKISDMTGAPATWVHHQHLPYGANDIIGYRKKVEPETITLKLAIDASAVAGTVILPRMTEAEVWNRFGDSADNFTVFAVLRDLGLLRAETPVERFARETGTTITDDNRAVIEAALAWEDAA